MLARRARNSAAIVGNFDETLARALDAHAAARGLDFDALPRYMPNVDSSHVIARTRWQTVVRQVGTTRFVARRTVRFELAFHRMNENEVAFEQTRGDFDRFRGVWSVRPEEAGSRVGYHAWITDDFGIPGFLVRHVVRRDAAKMMPAIAREVRRRHGEAG